MQAAYSTIERIWDNEGSGTAGQKDTILGNNFNNGIATCYGSHSESLLCGLSSCVVAEDCCCMQMLVIFVLEKTDH